MILTAAILWPMVCLRIRRNKLKMSAETKPLIKMVDTTIKTSMKLLFFHVVKGEYNLR